MGRFRHGWRPVWLGAALGVLFGFAGGAASGIVTGSPVAATPAPTSSEAPSPTVAPPAPSPSASPTVAPPAAGPAAPSAACGAAGVRTVGFRVLVEPGLATTPDRFVKDLLGVLCDRRSWVGSGKVRFRYDPRGSLTIGLRTPDSSERRCMQLVGLSVNRYYSCAGRREVVLNSDRWFTGSKHWPGSVAEYRRMLVNHEVGHSLGQHHRSCSGDGAPAPVMMQQSKGLTTSGRTCRPNPWPLSSELRALRR